LSDKKDDVVVTPTIHKDQFVEHCDTRYHFHIYEREGQVPVFLLESAENNRGPDVNSISEYLAEAVKAPVAADLKPDDLVWYEKNKKGAVERVHFCTFNMDLKHPKGWGVVYREESSIQEMLQEVARQPQGELNDLTIPALAEIEQPKQQVEVREVTEQQRKRTR
jgi:hypothetical protein